MENFLTWDVLLTFGGCVAGTILLTEWLKTLFDNLPSQLVSFVIALAILMIGKVATGAFVWAEVPLNLVNAVAVSLTANGGFDVLKRAFGKVVAVPNQLVVDMSDPGTENVYLDVEQDPKELQDGQVVTFTVKKISQE